MTDPAPGGAASLEALAPPHRVRTHSPEVAYDEAGPVGGPPVVLLHGFP